MLVVVWWLDWRCPVVAGPGYECAVESLHWHWKRASYSAWEYELLQQTAKVISWLTSARQVSSSFLGVARNSFIMAGGEDLQPVQLHVLRPRKDCKAPHRTESSVIFPTSLVLYFLSRVSNSQLRTVPTLPGMKTGLHRVPTARPHLSPSSWLEFRLLRRWEVSSVPVRGHLSSFLKWWPKLSASS